MKLKKLHMDNFKSMDKFEMEFNDLVIIAGNNSVGKTTVLHALDFLHYACTSDLCKYLEERGYKSNELLSQFSKKKTIHAEMVFENDGIEIVWEVSFVNNKDNFTLSQEKISCNNKTVLEVKGKKVVYNEINGESKTYNRLALNSSYIRFLDSDKENAAIMHIRNFFENSNFLNLLSPSDMRKPNRMTFDTIGQNGTTLAGFIKKMKPEPRENLICDVKKFFPNIETIKVIQSGKGWYRIAADEKFSESNIAVSANHISDGILRLIALFSLKYMEKSDDFNGGLIVLDEIEDGINTENIEGIYYMCKGLSESGFQVIITTHSTVLLDYAESNEIWYAARKNNGTLAVVSITRIDVIMEMLTYRYPGEAFLSTNDNEIRSSLLNYLDSQNN